MTMKTSVAFVITVVFSITVQAQEKTQIKIDLPKPVHTGTPRAVKRHPHLDPYSPNKPRPPIYVPVGCDKLLSRGCNVTASDPDTIIGELSYITDGIKDAANYNYVELMSGLQWIQIDLGDEKEIHVICIWHSGGNEVQRVYRDVICQISSDPDFVDGVVTVFNNDFDNSSGLGKGKDMEYIESNYGRPFAVDAVKGRYVRCYSRGNTCNPMNHYVEVEIFGRHIDKEQEVAGGNRRAAANRAVLSPLDATRRKVYPDTMNSGLPYRRQCQGKTGFLTCGFYHPLAGKPVLPFTASPFCTRFGSALGIHTRR